MAAGLGPLLALLQSGGGASAGAGLAGKAAAGDIAASQAASKFLSDVEITDDIKNNFTVKDGTQGGGEAFSVAPERENLSAEDAQHITENFQAPGDRASAVFGNVGEQNPGVFSADPNDLAEFEGTSIEGKTAKGVPEPEEISDLGKAFRDFAGILETPGARQFLGRMGIAFSEGREGSAGTVLGKSALEDVQGEVGQRLTQGLLEGKSMDEIDLGGANPSRETISQARESALSERQFEENQEQFDERSRLQERGQDMDFYIDSERLNLMEDRLGLRRGELSLDKLKTLGEMQQENKPDNVSSSAYGMAQKMAASTFLDTAKESFRNEQGELAEVSEIMNTLSTQNVGIDPTKIRSRLPDNLKQQFDNYVANVAKSISRTGQQAGQTGGFDVPTSLEGSVRQGIVSPEALNNVPTITSQDKGTFDQMQEGAFLQLEGRDGLFIKKNGKPVRFRGG